MEKENEVLKIENAQLKEELNPTYSSILSDTVKLKNIQMSHIELIILYLQYSVRNSAEIHLQ